ncbi:hypothetical protein CEXT_598441 [Caerostris extrusa]|uniref:Uncharacterized protein n=1 Tax=Caerostris extrusa TaxID=172846 RepID=A0AAV4RDB9_CAEEX|nr:hypothetical protein CEXT_598441 [Caerostris extrusa]
MQNEKSYWKHSLEIRKLSIVSITVTVAAKKKNIIISVSKLRKDFAEGKESFSVFIPLEGIVISLFFLFCFSPSRITNGSCSYFRADPCDNVVEDVSHVLLSTPRNEMQNEKSNWKHSPEIRKLSIVCVTVTVAAKKKKQIIFSVLRFETKK